MFTRQKILLALLQAADRPVSRLELTKWAFVMRNDSPSRGGASFYDFVPYHFGPFSFALYQEMDKLVTQGLVVQSDATHWSSSSTTPLKLEKNLATEAKNFGNKLAKRNIDNLIDEIYSRFPEYTVNSKRARLAERKVAAPGVYTSGYEGASIDGFLNRLVSSGIRHLVDVRRNPIARRYGFHRSTLKRLCESLGIQYSHIPELGIESEKRQELNSQEDYDALFRDYCDTTLLSETPAVERVTKLAVESPCVLVCMEAQPRCCHRSHLATEVSKRSKLHVEHLI